MNDKEKEIKEALEILKNLAIQDILESVLSEVQDCGSKFVDKKYGFRPNMIPNVVIAKHLIKRGVTINLDNYKVSKEEA